MKLYNIIVILIVVGSSEQIACVSSGKSNKKGEVMEKKDIKKMQGQFEEDVPLSEDLMREHGILNRVLLIYEEIIKRIEQHDELSQKVLAASTGIIKEFIEDHHEKMEEDYVFPLFEKNKKQVSLIKTLRKQHISGRVITKELQEIAISTAPITSKIKKRVVFLLQKFITMYRPHEAREDTVVFPQVRSFLTETQFEEMGELFEKFEHKAFGEHGFLVILHRVEAIEKELGIYAIEQFTPS